MRRALGLAILIVLVALAGCAAKPAAQTPIPPTTAPSVRQVTITITAKNMAFDQQIVTVPAGAHVTVVFKNDDGAVPHNFAVYENQSAQKVIFKGKVVQGGGQVTEEFDAPSAPGAYFFRCDIHPQAMTGQFITQ